MIQFAPLLVCIIALLLDKWLGEPRYHPLIAFGNFAGWVEKKFNNRQSKGRGSLSLMICVVPIVSAVLMVVGFIQSNIYKFPHEFSQAFPQAFSHAFLARIIFDSLCLYLAIGWQSMQQHILAVAQPLNNINNINASMDATNLALARKNLQHIVSRDVHNMNQHQVTGSALESLLENGNDALFATLFWYAVLGPAGAIAHRLINTLDAMWGYRSERFSNFGFLAAKLDDWMGWIPARLTAFLYAICGSTKTAVSAARQVRGKHKSPNAGLVMASGAGALRFQIGGAVSYGGKLESKPTMGIGAAALPCDIPRAIKLINKAIIAWLILYGLVTYLGHYLC